jgi:hypothetical protein
MTEDERKYLTALDDSFLVAARMHKGNTATEIYDALRGGVGENCYTVGTMAGLPRETTIEVVRDLIERQYIGVEQEGTVVSLLDAGAEWYMTNVLGMEPPTVS